MLEELKQSEINLVAIRKENSELLDVKVSLENQLLELTSDYNNLKKEKTSGKNLQKEVQDLSKENQSLKRKIELLEKESEKQEQLLQEKENVISDMKSSKSKTLEHISNSISRANDMEKIIKKQKKSKIQEENSDDEMTPLHPIQSLNKSKKTSVNLMPSNQAITPLVKETKRKKSSELEQKKNNDVVSKTVKAFSDFMGAMKIKPPNLK
jgi:chromosome segregation ATPase